MSDQQEPIDARDPRHPDHHREAERARRPDPELQRTVSDREYLLELEAHVSFLRRRVRQLGMERELQDRTVRQQELELAELRQTRDSDRGSGAPEGG